MRCLLPALSLLLLPLLACENTPPAGASVLPSPSATDLAAAQQLIQDLFDEVWSGMDTSAVGGYQTADFVLLEHGEVWTNDTIRNYQLRRAARATSNSPARKNSFTFLRTEPSGEDVWMAYRNTAHFVTAAGDTVGSAGWLESALATPTPTGWKLKMMHSTRLPRE